MAERRNATRHKSLLRGCIYFNNRRAAADCVIRDVSDTGARLIFSAAVAIPDVFDLYIAQKEQTLRAHVQWRHGEEIGVAFEGPQQQPEETPAADDVFGRLQRLEAEVASLRRTLKRLQSAIPAANVDAA